MADSNQPAPNAAQQSSSNKQNSTSNNSDKLQDIENIPNPQSSNTTNEQKATTPSATEIPSAFNKQNPNPNTGQNTSETTSNGDKTNKPGFKKLIPDWFDNLHLVFKFLLISIGVLALLYIIYALFMLTGADTQVFKLKLTGRIVTPESVPVNDAQVTIDGREFTTNTEGYFTANELEIGKYELTITADGFEDYTDTIALNRNFMNYETERTFTLKPTDEATVVGQFLAGDEDYKFIDDELIVANKTYEVNQDGTFQITDLDSGDHTLEFKSVSYKDETRKFSLDAGENNLADIQLTPAGDITGEAISWLREEVVADVEILPEDVTSDKVSIDQDGNFRIKDLNVGQTYSIRFQHPNYETRDYKVEIKQGRNTIPKFKLVEKATIPYLKEVDNELQIFASDLDGKDEKQLTDLEDTEPYAEYLKGDVVYYLSTRDNVSSELSGDAYLVYAVNLEGGNPQRITTNNQRIGRIIPNFAAQKLLNLREGEEQEHRKLEIMDLTGENRQELYYTEQGTFNDIELADNGEKVYFYAQDRSEELNGLYVVDVESQESQKLVDKPNIQIYSVSSNGQKVLYSATNESTGLADLYLYNLDGQKNTRLRQSFTGSQYQFVDGNENLLLYFNLQEEGSNIYKFNIAENEETRLTEFEGQEGVEAVYQQNGYILYQTNRGLYVMDLAKPIPEKLVTEDMTRYTGYDF